MWKTGGRCSHVPNIEALAASSGSVALVHLQDFDSLQIQI